MVRVTNVDEGPSTASETATATSDGLIFATPVADAAAAGREVTLPVRIEDRYCIQTSLGPPVGISVPELLMLAADATATAPLDDGAVGDPNAEM